ncbi:MAG: hypothetical protein OEX01_08695 [Candidatus Bathyarchaeota archaeon]|nr:hypothetical protein [Candidatus Bathyarchaeota archaeon]
MESKALEEIEFETLTEIKSLEKDYEVIKNFLKGVEFDLSKIRNVLQSFKDRMSKVRSLIIAFFQMQGKNFDFQTRPILDSIDMALVLMEVNPQMNLQQTRGILQLSLSLASIKIEDIMAFISTLKKTTFSQNE